jgi:tRNA threonylcarbamoyladenosine biosynthesis protein TsaB
MILALNTSGNTTYLQLFESAASSEPTAQTSWESGRALADELLSRLTKFTASRVSGLDKLTGIIIFAGPGSFTSLRIGHTVANALADSLAIPFASAGGERWQTTALKALKAAPSRAHVLPDYGSEANVTKPKT